MYYPRCRSYLAIIVAVFINSSFGLPPNYLPLQKLITAVTELEVLKPAVQEKLQELHYEKVYQLNKHQIPMQSGSQECSVEWPAISPKWNDYSTKQV